MMGEDVTGWREEKLIQLLDHLEVCYRHWEEGCARLTDCLRRHTEWLLLDMQLLGGNLYCLHSEWEGAHVRLTFKLHILTFLPSSRRLSFSHKFTNKQSILNELYNLISPRGFKSANYGPGVGNLMFFPKAGMI